MKDGFVKSPEAAFSFPLMAVGRLGDAHHLRIAHVGPAM